MADIKISQLGAALVLNDTDVFPITASGVTEKIAASVIKDYMIGTTSIAGIGDGSVTGAIDEINTKVAKSEVLVVSGTKSSGNLTISNAAIEDDMVCINAVLDTPSAQTGDWTVTTSAGSVTIAGNTSGSSTVTLYLMKSR